MPGSWEAELVRFLNELSAVQSDLLALLTEKQQMLVHRDGAGLVSLNEREADLVARLQACHEQRAELLAQATDEGLPGDSLRALASWALRSTPPPRDRAFCAIIA